MSLIWGRVSGWCPWAPAVAMMTLLLSGTATALPLTPLEFSGSELDGHGKRSLAQQAWQDGFEGSTRAVTFDTDKVTEPPEGRAFKAGGDAALLVTANTQITPDGDLGDFVGIRNAFDFRKSPNLFSLTPGESQLIAFNLLDKHNTSQGLEYGTTLAVGGFVSTLGPATLSVYDLDGGLIASITETPDSTDPYFLGFVIDGDTDSDTDSDTDEDFSSDFGLPSDPGRDSDEDALAIIATATFSLAGPGAFDGLVFGKVEEAGRPPTPPVPEPASALLLLTAFGLGIAGRRIWRRRR